eukprot:SM000012S25306  [mRNA]  locus=s12:285436:287490:- [translate_table: standard]
MDWNAVTAEEVADALREVDWAAPPRPLPEFLSKFSPPRDAAKWTSRLKCNSYYYRTNYFILTFFIFVCAFARNPLALPAVPFLAFSLACLNDSFAMSVSDKLTRAIRKISPPLAAKLRAPQTRPGPGARARPSKGAVHICGQDRRIVVGALLAVSLLVWYLTSAIFTVFGAIVVDFLVLLLHASFRSPNLKARLNSFREEFRAVWRGYSEA